MDDGLSTILEEFRDRLQRLAGARFRELVLYGSRARGDADPLSDVDVLVVMADDDAIAEYKDPITRVAHELSLKNDTVFACVLTTPERVEDSGMPFYRNIRREDRAV